MDRRYQVFVSSTFTDLIEERRAVMQALLEQDCIPAGMELFLATDQDQWDLIKGVIDDCDYYVVIVGARYGSMTEEGISFTEKEYDYAVDRRIPVLGFVHGAPESIAIGKAERTDEGRQKLENFLTKVMSRPIKRFNSAAELAAVVGASVAREIKRRPGVGWVRGDQAMTPETASEISDLRTQVAELELAKAHSTSGAFVQDTSDLAQGEDSFEVNYELGDLEWGSFNSTHTGSEELSWNDIVRALGPMMIDEAAESALRSRLQDKVLDNIREENRLPPSLTKSAGADAAVRINLGDFDKIKVQLRALGLIDKGTKRRGVADKQTYWGLTDQGDRYLASLLAIRRA